MTNIEIDTIIAARKHIAGDIEWSLDEDHSPSVEFRMNVEYEGSAGLSVRGSFNPLSQKLSYVLLYQGVGRIYALDLGTTLFDDTADVWSAEDFALVSDLSDVSYWSHSEDFIEKLAA